MTACPAMGSNVKGISRNVPCACHNACPKHKLHQNIATCCAERCCCGPTHSIRRVSLETKDVACQTPRKHPGESRQQGCQVDLPMNSQARISAMQGMLTNCSRPRLTLSQGDTCGNIQCRLCQKRWAQQKSLCICMQVAVADLDLLEDLVGCCCRPRGTRTES